MEVPGDAKQAEPDSNGGGLTRVQDAWLAEADSSLGSGIDLSNRGHLLSSHTSPRHSYTDIDVSGASSSAPANRRATVAEVMVVERRRVPSPRKARRSSLSAVQTAVSRRASLSPARLMHGHAVDGDPQGHIRPSDVLSSTRQKSNTHTRRSRDPSPSLSPAAHATPPAMRRRSLPLIPSLSISEFEESAAVDAAPPSAAGMRAPDDSSGDVDEQAIGSHQSRTRRARSTSSSSAMNAGTAADVSTPNLSQWPNVKEACAGYDADRPHPTHVAGRGRPSSACGSSNSSSAFVSPAVTESGGLRYQSKLVGKRGRKRREIMQAMRPEELQREHELKLIKSRVSARESRQRKKQYIKGLEDRISMLEQLAQAQTKAVARLTKENAELRARCDLVQPSGKTTHSTSAASTLAATAMTTMDRPAVVSTRAANDPHASQVSMNPALQHQAQPPPFRQPCRQKQHQQQQHHQRQQQEQQQTPQTESGAGCVLGPQQDLSGLQQFLVAVLEELKTANASNAPNPPPPRSLSGAQLRLEGHPPPQQRQQRHFGAAIRLHALGGPGQPQQQPQQQQQQHQWQRQQQHPLAPLPKAYVTAAQGTQLNHPMLAQQSATWHNQHTGDSSTRLPPDYTQALTQAFTRAQPGTSLPLHLSHGGSGVEQPSLFRTGVEQPWEEDLLFNGMGELLDQVEAHTPARTSA